ncbi:MAG: hypothetical protein ACYCOO_00265 [Chitinophagaceae bacterium]
MKKLAGISLLALLLYNAVGYYVLFIGFRFQANFQLEKHIESGHFPKQEEFIVKVPVNLPYLQNWKNFDRVDGDWEINGICYNAISHRLYQDTMYTVVIRDPYKNQLYHMMAFLTHQLTNALPGAPREHIPWQNLLQEYLPGLSISLDRTDGSTQIRFYYRVPALPICLRQIISPPPELVLT